MSWLNDVAQPFEQGGCITHRRGALIVEYSPEWVRIEQADA
jgi:hypothetical protein